MPFADITIKAPSGQTVEITPEEEAEFVRQAFGQGVISEINKESRLKEAVIESSIGAVGQAIGFAVGGLLAGAILSRIFRVKGY